MKYFLGILGRSVLWFITILLCLLVVSGFYQHYVNKDGYSGPFGIGYAVVVSGSMEPAIHIDDMIVYMEHPAEDYEVGDVIVYVREKENGNDMLITHRIVEINGDELTTRGDANTIEDAPIHFDQVVGRIVFRIPKVGVAVNFIKTTTGSIIAVAAVVLLLILNLILSAPRSKKHEVLTAQGTQVIKY